MQRYSILEIKKQWTEYTAVIGISKLRCVLENQKTKEITEKTVSFFQLIDLYSALENKEFAVTTKVMVKD